MFCFSHILSVFQCVFGNEGSKNKTKSDSLALLIQIGNNGYKQDKSAAQNSFNLMCIWRVVFTLFVNLYDSSASGGNVDDSSASGGVLPLDPTGGLLQPPDPHLSGLEQILSPPMLYQS